MSTAARIDELRKKFEENPRRYFAPLANELRKAGDVTQAIALCREFLPKQPGHMSGFIVFGQSLYEAGELEEARTVFEQALSLDPENLIALRHLGDIARASGDAAGARRWYERVLDADPRNDDIAAQLSTLAALRPQTPPTSQAETFESVAARLSETPPIGMDSIGFTVMPTPDSVMRAIDLDGLESRLATPFRDQAPIDLDAVEEAANPAPAEETQAAWSGEAAPELDVPELNVAFQNDDPFAFPEGVEQMEAEASADIGPTSHADAEFVEANFEEGLIAENWPDTSELEARVLTPRSVTPASVTPLSSAALDDAIAAFGREREPTPPAFDDRADGLEPVVESLAPDAHVEPLDAFEATSVEFEAPVSSVDAEQDIAREAPTTLDAITDEIEVPAAFETANTDATDTASFEAVTDELPIPTSFDFDVPGDAIAEATPELAAEATPALSVDAPAELAADSTAEFAADNTAEFAASDAAELAAPDAMDFAAPPAMEFAADADAEFALDDAAEFSADDAVEFAAEDASEFAAAEIVDEPVESTTEQVAEASELPWLASGTTPAILDAIEESEPGLEEIAGAFADDAKSAGDHGTVTVAALDDPPATGDAESFADVAQAIDEEEAIAQAASFAFDVEAEGAFEAAIETSVEAEHDAVANDPTQAGTPAAGSPAFVTETMGELLVAQGFIARAIEVYDELVRRRPFDPVLSSRLAELRAMTSPSVEQVEAAAPEAEVPAAASEAFDMFSPVMSDEFDVTSPTPAYGTPVSATPVMGATAFNAYETPAHATPAFTPSVTPRATPRVTPSVTPYAQPALVEEYSPRRSAGEWFAALAARRVPRRTPAQSAPAVESSPEGLASLFGDTSGGHDDAAARALADAFAPVSEQDLESGSVLDFDFARATPAYSPAVTMPVSASATPSHAAPTSFTASSTPSGSPATGGNAGFSFDKFFPDPATRRPTPAAPSSSVGNAPVSEDLAQFSQWLKGLGNP